MRELFKAHIFIQEVPARIRPTINGSHSLYKPPLQKTLSLGKTSNLNKHHESGPENHRKIRLHL